MPPTIMAKINFDRTKLDKYARARLYYLVNQLKVTVNKTIIIILAIIFIYNVHIQAQSTTDDKKIGVYVIGGIVISNYEELNKMIDQFGYSEFNNYSPLGGFGVFFTISNRLTMITEIHSARQSHINDVDQQSSMALNGIAISLAYKLLFNENLEFYPVLGLGRNSIQISLRDLIALNTSFSELVLSPPQQVGMTNSSYSFRLGEQIIYTPFSDVKSFFIGVQAGYDHSFIRNNWTSGKKELEYGPNINPAGFYTFLSIGFRNGL